MMWGFDSAWGWWPMMLGGLITAAFWVGVVILVIWAIVRLVQGPPRPAAPPPAPMDLQLHRPFYYASIPQGHLQGTIVIVVDPATIDKRLALSAIQ